MDNYEKKYKEALEKAKEFYAVCKICRAKDTVDFLEDTFFEIKESEDERIKTAILSHLKKMWGNCEDDICGVHVEDAIAWLEKQGEQKSINDTDDDIVEAVKDASILDMVKPKLKIESGKWYVCIRNLLDDYGNRAFCKGDVYLSEKDKYLIPCNSNIPRYLPYCVDTYFRNWTIQDAKDGDVLYHKAENGIEYIIMSKGLNEFNNIDSYFRYNSIDGFDINVPSVLSAKCDSITPATKEQRALLFQKMKEAGYEWDAEKKEVKKIEQKSTDEVKPKFHKDDWIVHQGTENVYQVVAIINNQYQLKYGDIYILQNYADVDSCARLWDITKDAKSGDVLASELCDSIILFRSIKDNNIDFYCDYDFSKIDVPRDRFAINNGQHYGNVKESKDFHPATKKQHDTLMTAMAVAGYTFDFDKKELKKIEKNYE